MLELLCIVAIRKANRAAAQARALEERTTTAQQTAQPVGVEASNYPPCTRTGCALRFNHTHI
jgi:hypothetical protein